MVGAMLIAPTRKQQEIKPETVMIRMVEVGPPKRIPLPPQPVRPPPPLPQPPPPQPQPPPPPKPPPPLPHPPPPVPVPAPAVIPKPPPPVPLPWPHPPRHVRPKRHPVHHVTRRPVPHPPPPAAPPVEAPAAHRIAAPPPTPAEIHSALAHYAGIMRSVILGNLVVPDSLRNLGASGTATVEFRVAPDGRILWVKLLRGSDYAAVNRAASTAVKISHFPGFLAKMPQHPITFVIPVRVSGAG